MFRFIFSLLFFLIYNSLVAQQLIPLQDDYIHKIENQIKLTTNDTTRLYNYLLQSEYWAATDSTKSKVALDNVISSPNKKLIEQGVLDFYQAYYYAHRNKKSKAIKYYENAIKTLDRNTPLLIKAYYNYAYIQVEDKGYDLMVKTLVDKCIPLSKELGNSELLAYSYTQLGLTFMSVGQFDTAEEYHNKALEELKKISQQNTVHLITYLNLVSNFSYKPDSKSAKIYLDKAIQLLKKYPNSLHYTNYYYQEALYYTTIQDYKNALTSLNKGTILAKANHQHKLLNMLYFRMYNVYLMQKDYTKAKEQLELILKENILNKEAFNRRITYTQLAEVENILGNYKDAYEWIKKSSVLGDSLQQVKLVEKMNELDVLHQTTEKQQKIDNLLLEKIENELTNQKKNLRIILLTIALLFSLVFVFLVYRTYKKQKQLNNQISINHQQELFYIEKERKYEATKAILQGEEQERQRIAQDLHDSIGGMLANIRMSISKEDKIYSNDLLIKIDKSIAEMRRISRNLMPETLKKLGLEIALQDLCESMLQKQFNIQFESYNLSNNIQFKVQLALYRISQECISNVIKHAQASNVIIQISQNENIINLTIEDDGVGFDSEKVKYGLGLNNIKNRSELINATVDIQSEQGKGTTINIECNV